MSKRETDKRWVVINALVTTVIFVLGLWLYVFPSSLQNFDRSLVAQIGLTVLVAGIVGLVMNITYAVITKNWQVRALMAFFSVICLMATALGYFTLWWFN